MDGSAVVFQRWDENQPLFKHNDENCAVMTTFTAFWHVYNCGFEHRSICKRSDSPHANATVAPTVLPTGGCPQNWKKFDSKCYRIINNQNETWLGAKAQCKAMGGKLASILSRKVQVFLTATFVEAPATDLWIGLYNANGRQFVWTDGRPMRYNNWGTNLQSRFREASMRPMRPSSWHYRHFNGMDFETDYERFHMIQRDTGGCAVMTPNPTSGIGKWMKRSCNDTNGYVCLQNVDPSFPESPEPTMTDYVNIFNDSIKLVSQQMNWEEAKMHCERDGAKLASLRNQWSQSYVEQLALNVIKDPVWIGMNKMETGGYFRNIDGWRLTATYWGRREPSPSLPCVFVDVDGKWKTADCNRNLASICMKSTDVPPTESSAFQGFCPDDPDTSRYLRKMNNWQPFKGNCYLFITERTKWADASSNCLRHGGNLVSIEDPSEEVFIQSNIIVFKDIQPSFWMGLYKTHGGLWKWLDKATMDYNNWNEDEPSDSTYGMIKSADGKWVSGNGWYDRGYICKMPKTLRNAPQTTVNPTVALQTRRHNILAVVLVVTAIAIGTVIAVFLFKKSGRRLSIPKKLSTFDNPLFFNNEQFDTNKLVANAEEENPGPVTAM